ncbi:uncharacterized protein Tco025E_05076 [Trypanosoma conorhini]|uniref:Uncharacterized protein n=1 Tax=Trypanosoma conorhini TaxID=83891 RepID=A0A3R7NDV7_9TRYP|nr:uncharacterized protein Tco025E_05076 [Trypanosoma conorhini]RNF17147.1 hypothetical protein Tco025E_05076 [Trypanosoma conorhini]
MPDFSTQVYWHDLPACPPPWKDEAEHARMWRISRGVEGNISDHHHHLLVLPRAELLERRRAERAPRKRVNRHWGIVLEPYLSPLHGLNMVMSELQVPPVTTEEAREAVKVVREEYDAMTQHGTQSRTLSQGGVKIETLTQQSTAAAMDLREAPLLEVVKILCASRRLEVTTFSKAELRRKGRLGVADVLPRRRVIMAFDRSKPLFVFATAVVAKKRNAATATACFLQLVAPTSNPVPWRRLQKGVMPHLPPNECVAVAVQRHPDDDEEDGDDDGNHSSGACGRNELLLGGDETDADDVGRAGVVQPRQQLKEEGKGDGNDETQQRRKRSRENGDVSDAGDESDVSGDTASSPGGTRRGGVSFSGRIPSSPRRTSCAMTRFLRRLLRCFGRPRGERRECTTGSNAWSE